MLQIGEILCLKTIVHYYMKSAKLFFFFTFFQLDNIMPEILVSSDFCLGRAGVRQNGRV